MGVHSATNARSTSVADLGENYGRASNIRSCMCTRTVLVQRFWANNKFKKCSLNERLNNSQFVEQMLKFNAGRKITRKMLSYERVIFPNYVWHHLSTKYIFVCQILGNSVYSLRLLNARPRYNILRKNNSQKLDFSTK